MRQFFTPPENTSQVQKIVLEDISYTEIPERVKQETDVSDYIVSLFSDNLYLLRSHRFEFENFLEGFLAQNHIDEMSIKAVTFIDGVFHIEDEYGKNSTFHRDEFENFRVHSSLKGENLTHIEAKVEALQGAIEGIYEANSGYIFNGEIDDNDRVQDGKFSGKTLSELKEILEIESMKLQAAYSITGDTHKQQLLLKQQITFFAGIGDGYEGGARYFSMSDSEIQGKVGLLIKNMSISEIFQTIIEYNENINSNWRKSDMVTQVNAKLMSTFYLQTLIRLQKEESPNEDIFQFVRIITGREKVKYESFDKHGKDTGYTERVSFDNTMANYDIASHALHYMMSRPGGVIEKIIEEKKDFVYGDPEIENKNPASIVDTLISSIDKLDSSNPEYGIDVLNTSGFEHLIGTEKNYNELSFDEKIQLGALYRIEKLIQDFTPGDPSNDEKIKLYIRQTSQEAFKAIESDFNAQFDGTTLDFKIAKPNFFGYSSTDLGLTGDFAQIFDLYQDMHGNTGFFDLHDANKDWFQEPGNIATLGVGIMAAIIILPLGAGSVVAMVGAGAALGLVTGITSVATSRKGYDTYEEALVDTVTQIAYEVVQTAVFVGLFGKFLKQCRLVDDVTGKLKFNPDLFFSKQAWTRHGLGDKFFIVGEVLAGMVGNGAITSYIRSHYPENYFDTDTDNYKNQEEKKKHVRNNFSLNPENYGP